jgi:hypothetical protein
MNAYKLGQQILRMTKMANANTPPTGYVGISAQQYMPTYGRRETFTPDEDRLIAANRKNVIPKIFRSKADSPAVDMASPAWAGVGGGLVGGALGLAVGGPGGRGTMAAGAGIGAIIGSIVMAKSRKAHNESIIENMRRLPPNGVRRDLEADPVYQAEAGRAAARQAATSMLHGTPLVHHGLF